MEKIKFDNKTTYFMGAQYFNGPYRVVNKDTGEVSEGITDKIVLTFLKPFDPFKNNSKRIIGMDVFTETVKNEHIAYIFGKEPQEFSLDMLDGMKGSPVRLEYTINQTARGSFATLRGVVPLDAPSGK